MSLFFDFFRSLLLRSKKHSFLFKISKNVFSWLSLLKKKNIKKGRFFDKNHGLTPVQNVDFFDVFRTSLLLKPELRDVLPTSQISIPQLIYVKRFSVYQIKIIYKEYMHFICWNRGRKNAKKILAV